MNATATTTFTHDKNGNLTFDGEHRYEWDARNRLRHVKTTTGSLVATYYYDAANRRVRKELASGTDMDYFYSGWQVLEERRASDGTIYRDFVDGNFIDEHIQMRSYIDAQGYVQTTVQKTYYYLQNTLYFVYGLADSDGDIVEAYEYDPYGKHILLTDGNNNGQVDFDKTDTRTVMGASFAGNPYTFTGRRFDPESGLHHYRNRYYSAEQGRFVSRDPIGYDGSHNQMEYVSSTPTRYVDYWGLVELDLQPTITIRQKSISVRNWPPGSNTTLVAPSSNYLGLTVIRATLKGRCKCRFLRFWTDRKWELDTPLTLQIRIVIYIKIQPQPLKHIESWAQRCEGDHADDLRHWARSDILLEANKAEDYLREKRWLNESDCQKSTKAVMKKAVMDSALKGTKKSQLKHDLTPTREFSKHYWGSPNQRP